MRSRAKLLGAFALGAVLAAGVAAIAAIPDSKGVIRACYAKKGGALRVSRTGKCHKGEKKLAFNQRGPQGQPGVGTPGQPGTPGRSALDPLHSGETIRGVWGIRRANDGGSAALEEWITFPVPAPSPVDSAHVAVAGNDDPPGDGCTGTAAAPVSAPGFVCAYIAHASATTAASGFGAPGGQNYPELSGNGSPYGFGVLVIGDPGFYADGTWAYTAP